MTNHNPGFDWQLTRSWGEVMPAISRELPVSMAAGSGFNQRLF
jgi:hypothetical protein